MIKIIIKNLEKLARGGISVKEIMEIHQRTNFYYKTLLPMFIEVFDDLLNKENEAYEKSLIETDFFKERFYKRK